MERENEIKPLSFTRSRILLKQVDRWQYNIGMKKHPSYAAWDKRRKEYSIHVMGERKEMMMIESNSDHAGKSNGINHRSQSRLPIIFLSYSSGTVCSGASVEAIWESVISPFGIRSEVFRKLYRLFDVFPASSLETSFSLWIGWRKERRKRRYM